MACTSTVHPYSLSAAGDVRNYKHQGLRKPAIQFRRCTIHRCYASPEQKKQRAPPGVDTRIHWDNEDDGWIGGSSDAKESQDDHRSFFSSSFSDLLDSSDSYYQFLGVPVEADIEEIKAAYRRLSKEYHPDTTSLPLKTASEMFLKLREIYIILSDQEKRQFYDWTLAQEAASRQTQKLMMHFDDPYEQDIRNYKSVPDLVDRLGGKNMQLNEQATSALTFDALAIVVSLCCIIYVLYFKEPY